MSCELSSGYEETCRFRGGVDLFAVFQRKNLKSNSLIIVSGEITSIQLLPGTQAYLFKVDPEKSSFSDVATSNENRSAFSAQTVNMFLMNNKKSTRNLVMQLIKDDVVIIARQMDDSATWKALGIDYGLRLQTGTNNSGVSMADMNGYELVFSRNNKELALDISDVLVQSLLVPAS